MPRTVYTCMSRRKTIIVVRTDASVVFSMLVVVAVDYSRFRYLVADAAVGSVDLARQQHHRHCRQGFFVSSLLPELTVSSRPQLWMNR